MFKILYALEKVWAEYRPEVEHNPYLQFQVSPILFSNDLSEYRDTLSRENDDATMKRYLPEQPPNYKLQSIPEAVLDSAKILQSTKILISPKPVIPTRCNGYRGFL